MTKIDKVIPIVSAKSRPKCGDCLHFKNVPKFERVCDLLGVKHFREAPTCFKVNPYILAKVNPDALNQIGVLMAGFTSQQLRVFAYMLRENSQLEKNYGVQFGQPVMFKIGDRDYLSAYFRGFVIGGATTGDPQLYVTSDMGKTQRGMPAMVTLLPTSVYKLSAWKKKKAQLIKDKKLKDPNPLYSSHVEKKDMHADYVPPTLENAPPEWLDKRQITSKGTMKSNKSFKKGKDGTLSFNVTA